MIISTKQNNSFRKISYRADIDGLRAFAVICVIINHFNKQILPGGYLGVDMFFVISGFVITSSLHNRPSENFKDFISGFYERRLKRLVPALSIFVLLMSFSICLLNPFPGVSLSTGLTSLIGFSNLYLLKQSTDYFAQSTELNVFTHTWSLGVEEQFYIFFPFFIWFSGFGKQTKNGLRNLFLIIGTLAIASLIGFIYFYRINQPAAYFLMPTRFWEMAAGCLLFITLKKRKKVGAYFEKIPSLLILALIVGFMYLPISFAIISTIAIVILSTFLIASLGKEKLFFKILTNKNVVKIGLISYSLYLWHWGVLSISRWTIGIHWWSIPFQLALIFFLSFASYKWIESPLRKSSWFGKRWKNLMGVMFVILSIYMNLILLGKPLKGKLFIGNQFNRWNMKTYRDIQISHNSNLPTVYLIGDSHAGHYGAAMTYLGSKNKFNVVSHPQGDGLKLLNNNYEEYILAPLREYKKQFKKGDIIIFSAFINKYKKPHNWIKQYANFIKETENIDIKYILISPTPGFPATNTIRFDCQKEWYRPSWAISQSCIAQINKNEWFELNKDSIRKIEKFLLENPKVSYLDAFSILCPGTYCKNLDQNILMYKDDYHLSSYGAMKISEVIETFVLSE